MVSGVVTMPFSFFDEKKTMTRINTIAGFVLTQGILNVVVKT
jgi:hypothetical protein